MRGRPKNQPRLWDEPVRMPNGLVYRPDFLTDEEERRILEIVATLELTPARFQEYTAKRKIGKWLDIPVSRVAHALVTQYRPGTPIGWHRDTEEFTHVVGVSLAGWCEMRFRPIGETSSVNKSIKLELEPRSAYIMQDDIRWKYQHHIPPTKTLRYSITYRTLPPEFRTFPH